MWQGEMWLTALLERRQWEPDSFFTFTMSGVMFSIQRRGKDGFFVICSDDATGVPLGDFYSSLEGLQSAVERVLQNRRVGIHVVDTTGAVASNAARH